ncbi:MAG: HPr family phosphocarrier protein [Clostridia bacterium]|nr:HPr family phosphocarrier protein [Clostridia bacterium]
MKQFTYTITDPSGIHARPAGLLAKAAGAFAGTEITLEKDGVSARAAQVMRLMSMGVRQGDRVTVSADGADEDRAIEAMKRFFIDNL